MMRGLRGWVLASGLLLVSTTAAGAPPASTRGNESGYAKNDNSRSDARAQARAKVKKAQLDYKLARFEDALQDYSQAYELYPAPALLFNLGQCHRNLKNYERAIFFFEGYLREQPKIDPDQRALAEDLVVECKTALDRQRAEAATAAARFAPPPMAPLTPRPKPAVSTRLALQSQSIAMAAYSPSLIASDRSPAPRDAPVTHRWWFWTAIVGTALAAGAVAYYTTGEQRVMEPSGSVGTLDRR
jgi:tetratricopeptide (TPR) repeat protein